MDTKPIKSKKIRKGDTVIAIAGNYKGMSGEVLSCIGNRVIVQGLNVRKRHMKPRKADTPGTIESIERPITISNLKPCNSSGKPVKLHTRTNADGERELYYIDGSKEVLYRAVKKSSE